MVLSTKHGCMVCERNEKLYDAPISVGSRGVGETATLFPVEQMLASVGQLFQKDTTGKATF